MERELDLRDTRGYNCVSYGAYVTTQKKIQVKIVGCREDGEHEYCSMKLQEAESELKMYESSFLTMQERLKLYLSIESDNKINFQLTTDTISTVKGKAIVAYTIAIWEDGTRQKGTDMIFNVTAWRKEV